VPLLPNAPCFCLWRSRDDAQEEDRKQGRMADPPAGGNNDAIIAGMGRVRTPDLTNKNADVKRKEKKQ